MGMLLVLMFQFVCRFLTQMWCSLQRLKGTIWSNKNEYWLIYHVDHKVLFYQQLENVLLDKEGKTLIKHKFSLKGVNILKGT